MHQPRGESCYGKPGYAVGREGGRGQMAREGGKGAWV